MSNFESSVKVIPYSQERVYNKLSDLSNLEAVKDRLPKDKVQDLRPTLVIDGLAVIELFSRTINSTP